MKLTPTAALLATTLLLAGCNSLDNPLGGLFGTGRDRRVFNSATGQFEWPKEAEQPRRSRAGDNRTGASRAVAAGQERRGDGRYFDVQKGQWVDPPTEPAPRSAKARPGAPATPSPTIVLTAAALPPPPPPSTASGVYNPTTGRIDWGSSNPAPARTPTPAPRKKWYWPF